MSCVLGYRGKQLNTGCGGGRKSEAVSAGAAVYSVSPGRRRGERALAVTGLTARRAPLSPPVVCSFAAAGRRRRRHGLIDVLPVGRPAPTEPPL